MGLTPEVFWRLTPRELESITDGYIEREQIAKNRSAWALTTIICSLGQFKHKPNAKKMYAELSGSAEMKNRRRNGNEKIKEILEESSERIRKRGLDGG